MKIPQLPWQIWIILTSMFLLLALLLWPAIWSTIATVAEAMTQFALFIQSMVLPCICVLLLGAVGYAFLTMRMKKN